MRRQRTAGHIALFASAAMALAGCGTRDYGALPKDERARALLCARTGVIAVGMRAQFDTPQAKDRVIEKVGRLNAATRFEALFPQASTDMAGAMGGAQAAANAVQSHWLSTLNACLKAYDIAEEPVAALPVGPYDQALTCAAATALDATGGVAINPKGAVADDPQGYYFIHKAASLAPAKPLSDVANAANEQVKPVLDAGTGHLFAEQCRAGDSKAVSAAKVPLPSDPLVAGVICTTTFASLKGRGIGLGADASNLAHRYQLAEKRVDMALEKMRANDATFDAAGRARIAYVAKVGNGDAVAEACLERFPPG